jgi:hypothetical protein
MYRIFLTALAIRKRIFTASTASFAAFCLQRCNQRAHANDERWRGDLFRQLAIVTVSRIAWAIGLSIAAGVILAGAARAQIVSNGSFEVPNVASAPDGFIKNLMRRSAPPASPGSFPLFPAARAASRWSNRLAASMRRRRPTAIKRGLSRISARSCSRST